MFRILTLNNISPLGLARLPNDKFVVSDKDAEPDAILVRSARMHDIPIPESVKAVGRAGAGVNNIPVDVLTKRGIPVFNTPGANANAVKELVIAGMLLAARNIGPALHFAESLSGSDAEISKAVEDGKKAYAGFSCPAARSALSALAPSGVLSPTPVSPSGWMSLDSIRA